MQENSQLRCFACYYSSEIKKYLLKFICQDALDDYFYHDKVSPRTSSNKSNQKYATFQ